MTAGAIDICEQRSDDWKQIRIGKVTASRMNDLLSILRGGGEAAGRRNLRAQMVVERLTGVSAENGFVSQAMLEGIENEKFALASYELKNDCMVERIGFVHHATIANAGCSPDGFIGDDGLIEAKCPLPATHIAYLLNGGVPSEYVNQMTWQLACTGRKFCDFVSFSPVMPEHLQLFTIRFPRDDKRIAELEAEVVKFNAEVESVIQQLANLKR